MRGLLKHGTRSSTIVTLKGKSVWRNKRPRSRTVFFAEDRLLTWSMSTSRSQEPTILSRIMPTCSRVVFEMMIFRNSNQSGKKFYYQWRKSHLMTLERLHKLRIRESQKLETVLELYDLEIHEKKIGLDYHRLKKRWWKEVSSQIYESGILALEMKIMKETPWSRIKGQNSVYEEFLETVGNGSPTGSVPKETITVSATILISVEKWHSRIRLRFLSCSWRREKASRTQSPRGKSQW